MNILDSPSISSTFICYSLDLTQSVISLFNSNNSLVFSGKNSLGHIFFCEFCNDGHHISSFLLSFHLFFILYIPFCILLLYGRRNYHSSSLIPFCFHLAKINLSLHPAFCCDFVLVSSICSPGVTIYCLVSQHPSSQEKGLKKYLALCWVILSFSSYVFDTLWNFNICHYKML